MAYRPRTRPPYGAGAGVRPPKLAGRERFIEEFDDGLEALEDGEYFGPRAFVGSRGLGKTVLLLELETRTQERGWKTHRLIVRRSGNIEDQMLHAVNDLLRQLQPGRQAIKDFQSRLAAASTLRVSTSNLAPLSVEWAISGERATRDRILMGADLQHLFEAMGDIAREKGSGAAIFIDEAHEARSEDLESLAVAIHELSTALQHRPLLVTAAGLPQLKPRMMNAGTYGERMFSLRTIYPLREEDVFTALREPAQALGRDYADDALAAIYLRTEGYPYLVQLWGEKTWRVAGPETPLITAQHVEAAEPQVIRDLDESFYSLRSARLSEREREYVEAMADLPRGKRKTADIAAAMKRPPEAASQFREGLIRKGVVREAGRGLVEFTVPGYDEYLKRSRQHVSRGFSI